MPLGRGDWSNLEQFWRYYFVEDLCVSKQHKMQSLAVPQVSAIGLCSFSHQDIQCFWTRDMAQLVKILATWVWEYEFSAQKVCKRLDMGTWNSRTEEAEFLALIGQPSLPGQFQANERLHQKRQRVITPEEEGHMKWSSGLDLHMHAYEPPHTYLSAHSHIHTLIFF